MKCLLHVSTLHTNFCEVLYWEKQPRLYCFSQPQRGVWWESSFASVWKHNREQEKVPTYQHLCLIDTAHLYVVCLLNTAVDPFMNSPFFPVSHPCWWHQASLYALNGAVTYVLLEAGDQSCTEVEWLKMLLSDKLFLTKLFFFFCEILTFLWSVAFWYGLSSVSA